MAHNPYRAPESAVHDVASAARPRPVALACRILWVVLVLSLITLHPEIRGEWWIFSPGDQTSNEAVPESEALLQDLERMWPALIVGLTVVFAALYGFLVWTTGKGHNWARWLLLAFVLGTTAMAAPDYGRSLEETPLAFAADICLTTGEVWAFWLQRTSLRRAAPRRACAPCLPLHPASAPAPRLARRGRASRPSPSRRCASLTTARCRSPRPEAGG